MTAKRKKLRGHILPLVFIGAFGLIGATLYLLTRASTNVVGLDINPNLAVAPAVAVSDSNASGGSAVQFKQATTVNPPPTATVASSSVCSAFGTQIPAGVTFANTTCFTMTVDGVLRNFVLYKPPGSGTTSKLVIVLHPSSSSAAYYQYLVNVVPPPPYTSLDTVNGLNAVANTNNYVVAYLFSVFQNEPRADGTTGTISWHSGNAQNPTNKSLNINSPKDVHYIDAVIDNVTRGQNAADVNKVYVIGSSAGALMVHRQACESVMPIRAFIAISGTNRADCSMYNTSKRTSILAIHGDADNNVSYNGHTYATGQSDPPVQIIMSDWASRMSCTTLSNPQPVPNVAYGSVTSSLQHWSSATGPCSGVGVDFLTLVNGGHSWGQGIPISGITPYIVAYINSH